VAWPVKVIFPLYTYAVKPASTGRNRQRDWSMRASEQARSTLSVTLLEGLRLVHRTQRLDVTQDLGRATRNGSIV
jgi:hypothetical protein